MTVKNTMNCQQATEKLEALQILREELSNTLVLLKDAHNQTIAGGITEQLRGDKRRREEVMQELKTKARAIRQELETGIKELNREMFTFTVPDAINPYASALKEAGLPSDHPECLERKEMILDMDEIIQKQIQHYRDQGLPEWAEDIEKNKGLLFDLILDSEEQEKIEKRIKAGMIPIVMPSREAQRRTLELSLKNLKPIWIGMNDSGTSREMKAISETRIDYPLSPSFFDKIPDRPYCVWTRSNKIVDESTLFPTFNEQVKELERLHKEFPDLVDSVDIIPAEYMALQSLFTNEIFETYKKAKKILISPPPYNRNQNLPANITPIDNANFDRSKTRFISVGLFSGGNHDPRNFSHTVNFSCFNNRITFFGQVGDVIGWNYKSHQAGFRTVARS